MSEPAAKRQPIDLNEFERRLRAPATTQRPGADEDPLAELARLVSASPDPFAPIFAAGRPGPRGPGSATPEAWNDAPPFDRGSARAPQPPAPPQGLRPGYDDTDGHWPQSAGGHADPGGAGSDWDVDPGAGRRARQGRSRGSVLMVSAALAVVLAGVAGTLALRGHVIRIGAPPVILADAKPFKVRPPSQPQKDQIETATTLLDKSGSDALRPARIVNTEEEPVDLALATPSKNGAPAADGGGADEAFSAFPAPRRVKTVLVRPDGSIISPDDQTAGASGDPAAPPANGATTSATGSPSSAADGSAESASAGPAAPTSSAAAAPAPPEARAPSFANVVDQAAADSEANAPPVADASAAPSPPVRATPPARTQSADLSEDHAAARTPANDAVAAGDWAVQLAAPATEREAHTEIARLQRKFAAQLDGKRLLSHSAQSNGRTVWRVRVAGLSRDGASALCSHIKGGGGACFVTRD